jgi:hypothetical protein
MDWNLGSKGLRPPSSDLQAYVGAFGGFAADEVTSTTAASTVVRAEAWNRRQYLTWSRMSCAKKTFPAKNTVKKTRCSPRRNGIEFGVVKSELGGHTSFHTVLRYYGIPARRTEAKGTGQPFPKDGPYLWLSTILLPLPEFREWWAGGLNFRLSLLFLLSNLLSSF